MFSILSLNVNDFGGIRYHLQEYKNEFGPRRYWDLWKQLDKSTHFLSILSYIKKVSPSIVILYEFEVNNSEESQFFITDLSNCGFEMISNIPKYKASVTAVFVRSEFIRIPNPNTLDARSYAFKVGNIIIYGTHVPPKGKDRITQFWDEIDNFYKKYCKEKILLIGDFNTINPENMKRYKQLLNVGGVDVWLEKGYPDNTPTCGTNRLDIVIASPALFPFVTDITVCPSLLYKGMTDHAALIVDIDMNNK